MIVLTHVFFAIASLAGTTYACLRPSNNSFRAAYVLIAGTLASGTFLLISHPAHLTQTCISGLSYIGLTLAGLSLARFRLARAVVRVEVKRPAARREWH